MSIKSQLLNPPVLKARLLKHRASKPQVPVDSQWATETLVHEATTYFAQLCQDIDRARRSVRLESYIFDYDPIGQRVIAALSAAVSRGLDVRVLLDGIGSAKDGYRVASALEAAGVAVGIYHPIPWRWGHYRWSLKQGGAIEKFFHLWSNINRRNHRKLCAIDQQIAWCGSFNICAVHMPTAQGGENWRDYGVRVSGEHVKDIAATFDAVWHSGKLRLERRSFKRFLSNVSLQSRLRKNTLITQKIAQAKSRVWISSAYFAPRRRVIKAMQHAARRGIDVRLLVSRRSDVLFFPALTATYYSDLLRAGVKVYEFEHRVMHAKVMLVDDEGIVGSSNLNHRSFLHDLELDIVIGQQDTIGQLSRWLAQDMALSSPVQTRRRHRWRLSGAIAKLFRYWF